MKKTEKKTESVVLLLVFSRLATLLPAGWLVYIDE